MVGVTTITIVPPFESATVSGVTVNHYIGKLAFKNDNVGVKAINVNNIVLKDLQIQVLPTGAPASSTLGYTVYGLYLYVILISIKILNHNRYMQNVQSYELTRVKVTAGNGGNGGNGVSGSPGAPGKAGTVGCNGGTGSTACGCGGSGGVGGSYSGNTLYDWNPDHSRW